MELPRPETKQSRVFGKIPDRDRDRLVWSSPDWVPIGLGPNFPNTSSHAKPMHHQPYGLLKQLPVPEKPWNLISLDFREKLPLSSSSYTAILVIVDHLSKQGLFIPTHDTITSQQLAQLFILHIFSKHGIPSHVTSDHRSEFVSHFFCSLGIALAMKLHFTSRYHPEGDGQME